MTDIILLALLGIAGLAAFTVFIGSLILARRKVRKEIGLLKQHLAYRPARPARKLHFGEYGKPPDAGGVKTEG